MQAKKVWSYILIVLGVILGLWGLMSFYGVYQASQQMSQVKDMAGGMMSGAAKQASPSYFMPVVLLVLGVAGASGGTYMLKSSTQEDSA